MAEDGLRAGNDCPGRTPWLSGDGAVGLRAAWRKPPDAGGAPAAGSRADLTGASRSARRNASSSIRDCPALSCTGGASLRPSVVTKTIDAACRPPSRRVAGRPCSPGPLDGRRSAGGGG